MIDISTAKILTNVKKFPGIPTRPDFPGRNTNNSIEVGLYRACKKYFLGDTNRKLLIVQFEVAYRNICGLTRRPTTKNL